MPKKNILGAQDISRLKPLLLLLLLMAGARYMISCLKPFGGRWMCRVGMGGAYQGEVVARLVVVGCTRVAIVLIIFILYT